MMTPEMVREIIDHWAQERNHARANGDVETALFADGRIKSWTMVLEKLS